jgi:putative transposase
MLGHVSKAQQPMIAAAIRGIFQATSLAEARERLAEVVDKLAAAAPKVATLLEAAEAELLAVSELPSEHWSKLRSTNPLERVNREIGRRTDVVGHLPQRRRAAAPGRHAARRAERRVAGRPPLPIPGVPRTRPR